MDSYGRKSMSTAEAYLAQPHAAWQANAPSLPKQPTAALASQGISAHVPYSMQPAMQSSAAYVPYSQLLAQQPSATTNGYMSETNSYRGVPQVGSYAAATATATNGLNAAQLILHHQQQAMLMNQQYQNQHLMAMQQQQQHLLLQQQQQQQQQQHKMKPPPAPSRTSSAAAAAASSGALPPADDNPDLVGGDEDEVEDHKLYNEYEPKKILKAYPLARPHPDPIVETASLAGVTPPDLSYNHHLDEDVRAGRISSAQLETVMYAMMRFRGSEKLPDGSRKGFFLGDGAGVGKGRQIAALIKEFFAAPTSSIDAGAASSSSAATSKPTRVLWVSTSNDLKYDAMRDLEDMSAPNIKVFPPGKATVPKGDLSVYYNEGVLFMTYSLLIHGCGLKAEDKKGKGRGRGSREASAEPRGGDGSATYRTLGLHHSATDPGPLTARPAKEISKGSRLDQIIKWLSESDNALIVFDECHKAKNFQAEAKVTAKGQAKDSSTQTGKAVEYLQRSLPNACVLYSSATGASEPDNLRYMVRLGSYGYRSMGEMVDQLKKSGLGALEIFAMGLKATGAYLSRTLSYRGAEFRLDQTDLDARFKVMYNRSTMFWRLLHEVMLLLPPAPSQKGGRDVKRSLFWSANQRFFRQMLIAGKVKRCSILAKQAIEDGQCVVIGLQSTGEANSVLAKEEYGDETDDLVSAPRMVLLRLIKFNLFNFKPGTDFSEGDVRKLQAVVFRSMQEWAKLPSCEMEAAIVQREEQKFAEASERRQNQEEKRKLKEIQEAMETRKRAEASASGALASSSAAAAAVASRAHAIPSHQRSLGVASSSLGGGGGGGGDDIDDIVEVKTKTIDEVLADKKRDAILQGRMLDLTADSAIDAALVEMEADEEKKKKEATLRKLADEKKAAEEKVKRLAAEVSRLSALEQCQPRLSSAATPMHDDDDDLNDSDEEMVEEGGGRGGGGGSKRGRSQPAEDGRAAKRRTLIVDSDDDLTREDNDDDDDDEDDDDNKVMDKEEEEEEEEEEEDGFSIQKSEALKAKAVQRFDSLLNNAPSFLAPLASARAPAPAAPAPAPAAPAAARRRRRGSHTIVIDATSSEEEDEDDVGDEEELEVEESDDVCILSPSTVAATAPRPNPQKRAVRATTRAQRFALGAAGGGGGGGGGGSALVLAARADLEEAEADLLELNKRLDEETKRLTATAATLPRSSIVAGMTMRFEGLQGGRDLNGKLCRMVRFSADNPNRLVVRKIHDDEEISVRLDNLVPVLTSGAANANANAGGGGGQGAGAGAAAVIPGNLRGTSAAGQIERTYRHAVDYRPLSQLDVSRAKPLGAASSSLLLKKGAGGGGGRGRDEEEDEEDEEDEAEEEEEDEDAVGGAGGGGPGGTGPVAQVPLGLKKVQDMLLRMIEALELPANPLDQLVELLGGEGRVAEMTGRKAMTKKNDDGKYQNVKRGGEEAQKMVNMAQKNSFMNGEKLIAIISEAASTGISLQADKRARNQRRRFHITLELPWSADKAIQQFGRSHRSNQTSAPIYCMLISKCAGEYRFAGAVAKRLQSLGALLQGDRRALGASASLRSFDVDNKWGSKALTRVFSDLSSPVGASPMPGVLIPDMAFHSPEALRAAAGGSPSLKHREFYNHCREALHHVGLGQASLISGYGSGSSSANSRLEFSYAIDDKLSHDVPRFLNRLLGMPLSTQRYLFDYFSATLDATIKVARGEGKYESGIEVLSDKSCVTVEKKDLVHVDRSSGARTYHLELEVDDGLSWDAAVKERDECIARMRSEGIEDRRISKVGFYVSKWTSNFNNSGHPLVILATEVPKRYAENKQIFFRLLRPNQCTANVFSSWDLSAKYEMTPQTSDTAMKAHWSFWYDTLGKKGAGNARGGGCMHGPNCKVRRQYGSCQYGSRLYKKYLVTGAVLPVIQKVFEASKSDDTKGVAKALRTNTKDGKLLVGLSLSKADSEDFRLACQ